MSDVAVKVEDLGKCYRIRHKGQAKYKTFQDALKQPFINFFNSGKNNNTQTREDFWALKDVSFEIKQGDRVGIIGRNGAGKSTLLKVLSRITEPTTGRIEIHGRLASLLEVGTGFHVELTGRENIFLNGNILGMKRREIQRKFDEIVDFADVEKFLDTPVKRYSSGMYVRLAFAVAAHLESEILVIDEVLAVGDAEFQKKCMGKMENMSKSEGRTVLFVSHNMGAVKKLCNKGILMEGGQKKAEGEMSIVAEQYTNRELTNDSFKPFKIKDIDVTVTKVIVNEGSDGLVTPYKPMRVDIEMEATRDLDNIGTAIWISHEDTSGVVFATNTKTVKNIDLKIRKGKNKISCVIDKFNLCSGRYWLGFAIEIPFVSIYYSESMLLPFYVEEVMISPSQWPTLSPYGHVYLDHNWIIQN